MYTIQTLALFKHQLRILERALLTNMLIIHTRLEHHNLGGCTFSSIFVNFSKEISQLFDIKQLLRALADMDIKFGFIVAFIARVNHFFGRDFNTD